MRILLSAFACEPVRGSEPGNGWTWAEALSRDHDVVVLTDGPHRARIEAALAARPNPRLEFHYLGSGPRGYEGLEIYPYYEAWQRRALEVARRLHARHPFDVVHHATYGQHRTATYLGRLGVPFIWGPLGGGEGVPPAFYHPRWIGPKESVKELVRWAWNVSVPLNPGIREAARRASVLAVTSEQTLWAFPPDTHHKAVILPSSVLNRADVDRISRTRAQPGPADGLSLAYAGRLIGWKGPSYAMFAFARYAARYPAAEFHLYGDGGLRGWLEDLAVRLGLGGRVFFHGNVPRAEMLLAYARHHAFLFPSLHDSSGFVTIEAMTAGLPVVCLDVGGPGLQVPAVGGVKVKPVRPEQAVFDLAKGLASLTDPARWAAASRAARAHALNPASTPTIEEMIERLYGRLGLPGFDADRERAASRLLADA